jgi:hypothetical protein
MISNHWSTLRLYFLQIEVHQNNDNCEVKISVDLHFNMILLTGAIIQ